MNKILLSNLLLFISGAVFANPDPASHNPGVLTSSQLNFSTYSTIFQDYALPANMLYYPFNRQCGWQPGTVIHNYEGEFYKGRWYKYDSYGNMTEDAGGGAIGLTEPNFKTEYNYNKSGHLISESDYFKRYDDEGNIVDEWIFSGKTDYQYNKDGYVTKEDYFQILHWTDDLVETTSSTEYEYDDVVKNYLIKTTYIPDPNENITGNYETGTETKIYRNSVGNIVKIEFYRYHALGFDYYGIPDEEPDWYEVIEYDENNIARNIKLYGDDDNLGLEYYDIEWVCTDGQILFDLISFYPQDYGLVEFNGISNFTHYEKTGTFWTELDMNNLIKSVNIKNYGVPNDLNTFHYEFDYPDLYGSYSCKMSYNDLLLTSYQFSILDSEGSYISYTHYHNAYDWQEETFIVSDYVDYHKVFFDYYGLQSSYVSGEGDPSDPQEKIEEYEIKYNEDLLPAVYNYGYHNREQNVYADYYRVTNSVESPMVDDAPTQYFTIQGMPVREDRLTPGLYIKVKGNRSEKVIIR